MPKKRKNKKLGPKINDDEWIRQHFEEIVDRYGGQHIVVCNGEIFVGEKAIEEARKKYPHIIPISMPVPRPEEFMHILICHQL